VVRICTQQSANGLFCERHWKLVPGSARKILRDAVLRAVKDVALAQTHLPDPGAFRRVSHDIICPECHREAIDHPTSEQAPFLNVMCDGTFVKL
jgi:hypothetical protein